MRIHLSSCFVGLLVASGCAAADVDARTPPSESRLCVLEDGVEVAVRWLTLTAEDSLNRRFVLCFEPHEHADPERQLALSFDGRSIGSTSSHRLDDGAWHRSVVVERADIERMSDATGLSPARYVRRDVQLAASFGAEARVDSEGRRVPLKLVVRNDGNATVRWNWGGWQRGANRHGRMRYTATRDGVELAVLGETQSFGGLGMVKELRPGESLEELDDLAAWFDLSTLGLYRVHAEYGLTIVEPVPTFSSPMVCPSIGHGCVEILSGDFEFEVPR